MMLLAVIDARGHGREAQRFGETRAGAADLARHFRIANAGEPRTIQLQAPYGRTRERRNGPEIAAHFVYDDAYAAGVKCLQVCGIARDEDGLGDAELEPVCRNAAGEHAVDVFEKFFVEQVI